MPASEADAYLIEQVQAGDATAWREVIERYQGRLVSFARRRLADQSEAEDIVQEAFLGLMRSLPNFDKTRSLETYLFAILRHKLNDHFRRQRGGQRQSLDALQVDDTPEAWLTQETPSHRVAGDEALAAQRDTLVECLRRWVEQCQEQRRFQELVIVEMLMVLGMRNKEVAADLELSETAVAGVKYRVIERWKQITVAAAIEHDWREADLAENSTVAKIWRDEGISCLKRSTLGRYVLEALDPDWMQYIEFHVDVSGCERCLANLDDLRAEERADEEALVAFRDRCFASSIGFISQRPESNA